MTAPPEPEPQSLHETALQMLSTIERLGVLPEICDTIRRAIREPMAPPVEEPLSVGQPTPEPAAEGQADG